MKVIGWAPALNCCYDQTGTCHAMQSTITGMIVPVCGTRLYASGGFIKSSYECEKQTRTHACKTCLQVLVKSQEA